MKNTLIVIIILSIFIGGFNCSGTALDSTQSKDPNAFYKWAAKPPMGWNSWNCWGLAVDDAKVRATLLHDHGIEIAGGFGPLAGKVFRIGHLGDLNELMLMGAIAGAEMAMLDLGVEVEPGSGVAAAGTYWRTHPAPAGLQA